MRKCFWSNGKGSSLFTAKTWVQTPQRVIVSLCLVRKPIQAGVVLRIKLAELFLLKKCRMKKKKLLVYVVIVSLCFLVRKPIQAGVVF
jgi:hypothetical protein